MQMLSLLFRQFLPETVFLPLIIIPGWMWTDDDYDEAAATFPSHLIVLENHQLIFILSLGHATPYHDGSCVMYTPKTGGRIWKEYDDHHRRPTVVAGSGGGWWRGS